MHLYTGSAPSRQALTDGFHFSEDILSSLYSFPLEFVSRLRRPNSQCSTTLESSVEPGGNVNAGTDMPCETSLCDKESIADEVSAMHDVPMEDSSAVVTSHSQSQSDVLSLSESRKRKYDDIERERRKAHRLQQISEAQAIIEGADMDGLIVATKSYPTPIVCRLLDFVKPSRPIVVFSPYKEPLIDCYSKLRETGRVILVNLSETWLRSYQVLPNRTHPSINMCGSGGFLLTATVVDV